MNELSIVLSVLSIFLSCVSLNYMLKLRKEIEEQIAINTLHSEKINNIILSVTKRPY